MVTEMVNLLWKGFFHNYAFVNSFWTIEIKHDFFKNLEVLLEKLIQDSLELVFFCDFHFLPTGFKAGKAKNLLNFSGEFCQNCFDWNVKENISSVYAISARGR